MVEPVLHMADLVLVMSVNPGYGGQSFIAETLDKVRELRMRRAELGLGYLIEIDGGVNLLNAAAVCEAVVILSILYEGSYLWLNLVLAAIGVANILIAACPTVTTWVDAQRI